MCSITCQILIDSDQDSTPIHSQNVQVICAFLEKRFITYELNGHGLLTCGGREICTTIHARLLLILIRILHQFTHKCTTDVWISREAFRNLWVEWTWIVDLWSARDLHHHLLAWMVAHSARIVHWLLFRRRGFRVVLEQDVALLEFDPCAISNLHIPDKTKFESAHTTPGLSHDLPTALDFRNETFMWPFVVIRIQDYGDLGVAVICSAHTD